MDNTTQTHAQVAPTQPQSAVQGTENDAAIARALAEAEEQQRRGLLWGRSLLSSSSPSAAPPAPQSNPPHPYHHQHQHHHTLSAPPALEHTGVAGTDADVEEDLAEEDDETVESLSQEAARAMGRLPPNVRDSLRRMPSLEKGMAVNTESDEAIARAVAQSEQVSSAEVISIGRRFDRKIRRVLHRVKAGMVDEVSAIKEAFRPRVNSPTSFTERPEDFMNGKQLLQRRLDMYTLAEFSVPGNGDCQFASLADQLYRTTGMAAVVRHTVVNYLRAHADEFKQYVPDDYGAYCDTMDKRGTWGDHVTLQAAANLYGVVIHLLTSYKDTPWMEIRPQGGVKTQKSLWLSFLAELHYNSLYSRQDINSRLKAEEELRTSYAARSQQEAADGSAPPQAVDGSSTTTTTTTPAGDFGGTTNGPPVLPDSHHHCLLM